MRQYTWVNSFAGIQQQQRRLDGSARRCDRAEPRPRRTQRNCFDAVSRVRLEPSMALTTWNLELPRLTRIAVLTEANKAHAGFWSASRATRHRSSSPMWHPRKSVATSQLRRSRTCCVRTRKSKSRQRQGALTIGRQPRASIKCCARPPVLATRNLLRPSQQKPYGPISIRTTN